MTHSFNPHYLEGSQFEVSQDRLFLRPPSPKYPEQNGLEVWFKQAGSPEFKPQSHQKKMVKKNINFSFGK
jgi:hypothetical protein